MNDPAIPEDARAENARQLSMGASGEPEGFIAGGRVYIVASAMHSPDDVTRVLLHESLGHFGLRGLYGEGLNKILKQMAALRRRDVEAMAKRYGLDMGNEVDRLKAAEEVLAHLAQTRPTNGFVQRAIAAIRAWLRENIPGFANLKLSDGEIIENYLLPARRFVEQGGMVAQGEMAGAFSRTARTRSTYEKRIDELFRGAPSNQVGVRVMDRSDVLSMLGYPSGPVLLRERKVKDGLRNHPRMTAEHWKKVPEWLDSPALVFDSDTIPGRIVFFAPEQLQDGTPIMMVLEPATPKKGGEMTVSLLVNAYDRTSMPLGNWLDRGLLRYYDKEKSPALVDRSGLYMTSLSQARGSKGRIYTDADLVKYRNSNPFFSRSANQTDTPAFKAWFGDSKVVDENGKPLVVYRGMVGGADINERALNSNPRPGYAAFASDSPHVAASYAHPDDRETGAVVPVFVKADSLIEFPVETDTRGRRQFDKVAFDKAARSLRPGEVLVARGVYDIGPRASVATDPAMKYSYASDIYAWGSGTQVKSAIGNNGDFDPASADIRFSRSATAPSPAAASPALSPWRERMERIVDTLIYNFQDRFKPLRDIQKKAGPVPERQDASLAEERYSGMVRARTDDFHAELCDPLISAIHEGNLDYDEVEEYLHARHAPSRNAAMREINPTREELDRRIESLSAQRDELAQESAVAEFARLRRDLRNARADIEDGLADESPEEAIREEIDKLRRWDRNVADYIEVTDKLRALRGIKPVASSTDVWIERPETMLNR